MTDVPTMSNIPAPPYTDDDEEPEFTPRPRRRAHALTFVLAGALLIAAGFLGGVLLQKHEDHGTSTATTAAGRRAGFTGTGATGTGTGGTGTGGTGAGAAGGRGGFGGFGGGAAGGGGVTGTVKLVDGKNVYVTDTNGNVTKVATNAGSTLTKTDSATIADVAPGDVVIVRGTPNSDGSFTATSLLISPTTTTNSAG